MNARASRSAVAAIGEGAVAAMQWRLLLLWVMLSWLPTLAVALPLWTFLDERLGHSVHARAWAERLDGLMLGDVMHALGASDWPMATFAVGGVLTLLMSPFLAGLVVAAGQAGRAPGFGALLQGGAAAYGRLLRLFLPALLPYGLVVLLAKAVMPFVDRRVDAALSQSRADLYHVGALALLLVCFGIAQAIVESARAQFIADPGLRSALRAFGRGVMQFARRPFASLAVYATITIVGAVLALAVAAWRGHVVPMGGGIVGAFLVVQLGVVVVAWMRIARLLGLSALATHAAHRRRRSDFAPAF